MDIDSDHKHGFNLIELMVTITIAAILLGIGVPSLVSYFAKEKAISAAEDIYSTIALAKSLAHSANKPIVFKLFNTSDNLGVYGLSDTLVTNYSSCVTSITLADLVVNDVVYKTESSQHPDVTYTIGNGVNTNICIIFDNVRGITKTFPDHTSGSNNLDILYNDIKFSISVSPIGHINLCSNNVGNYKDCP